MVQVAAIKTLQRWYSRHKKKLWIGVAGILLLSVAVQLVYPYGHALPLASVAGQSVGMKKQPEITLEVQNRFSEAVVNVEAGTRQKSDKLQYFGAEVDANGMAEHATNYPFIFRFVPLSIFWYQPNLDRFQISFDDDRLKDISKEYAEELSYQATNANLALKDGELTTTESEPGSRVETEQVHDAIRRTSFNWDSTDVKVEPTTLEPNVSDALVADVRQRAEAVLDQEIVVSIDGQREYRPSRAVIATWLKVSSGGESNSVVLEHDEAEIGKYVRNIAEETDDSPEPVNVRLVDGEEADRKGGKPGLGVDRKVLVERLSSLITAPQVGSSVVAVERQPIEPPLSYDRSYTSSEKGLRAYVEHVSSSSDINIAVTQLEADRWTAMGNANQSIASASTYKPYLMLKVLDDIRRKALSWDDKVGDTTIRDCFENMIVVSANSCAEALIDKYGVGPLTSYLRKDLGFSSGTGFTFSEVTQTTAADLNRLMVGIENSSLVRGQYRNMMLEKMSRQVYRQGIPAGTNAEVYNKPGFLWDYLHDAGIVKHPKGTYVLVVLTKGESWSKIAEITKQIERIMYG